MAETRGIVAAILSHFPAQAHALTLVSDPDEVLADEGILAALSERGFTLVRESDPIRLRYRIEEECPFTAEHPLIVVTAGQLNELPYDLWQQGHDVTLALHTFFPRLAYPVARALTPTQRWRASLAPAPGRRLGRRATVEYLLREVFGADVSDLDSPAQLVRWLNDYHQESDTMPKLLADELLDRLRAVPAYAQWPLEAILLDREAFFGFVREQWGTFVARQTGQLVCEPDAPKYVLPFGENEGLQDTLPALVRSRAVEPVCVQDPGRLPAWARPALREEGEDRLPMRLGGRLDSLSDQMSIPLGGARWERWQGIARTWAELHVLVHSRPGGLSDALRDAYLVARGRLDRSFLEWLRSRYAPLAVQRLPTPHHVHHVPDYMAFERRQGRVERVTFLVMDGMALADWYVIRASWRARHPDWSLDEQLVLAQIPTTTAISRQALVSGLRPADFADTVGHNRAEMRRWSEFWAREGLVREVCGYVRLRLDREGPAEQVTDSRVRALCLIDNSIDELLHGVSLGAADVVASLRVWLEVYSPRLEALMRQLLATGFTVFVSSDHGHVEALGIGQPSEGLTVETRCRRARVYRDRHAMARVRQDFPQTLLWENDGLLPGGTSVLIPEKRLAFAARNDTVVTHGGPTLEEVVVPLVTITQG